VGANYTISAYAKGTESYLNLCGGPASALLGGAVSISECYWDLLWRNPITEWSYQSLNFTAKADTVVYVTAGYIGDDDFSVDDIKLVQI